MANAPTLKFVELRLRVAYDPTVNPEHTHPACWDYDALLQTGGHGLAEVVLSTAVGGMDPDFNPTPQHDMVHA
jgi:hypothetical protein